VAGAASELRPSQIGDFEVELVGLAACAARAVDLPDLAARLALGLGHRKEPSVPVRIWLLNETEQPTLVARYPPRARHPNREVDTVVAAAFTDEVVRTRSTLVVALRCEGVSFGVLVVGSHCSAGLKTISLLAAVVAARVDALRQSDLERPAATAARMTELATDTHSVIGAFAAEAKQLLDHDRLSVYMLTPDGQAFERFAVATSPVLPGEGNVIPLQDVGLTYVLKTNHSLVSHDLATDERLVGREDSVIAAAGYHGLVSAPLRVGGKPIGVLNFVSQTPGFYTEQDAVIAQQISDQVAIFFQNLRLEQRVRLAIERDAAQQERNRLAHELHDTLAQSLAGMLVKLDVLAKELKGESEREVITMRAQVQTMIGELRRSLLCLRPAELEHQSLDEAMRTSLAALEADHRIKTSLELLGPLNLSSEVETTLFRIFQEAIANVRKHADASAVSVTLRVGEGLVLSVEDNGRGFIQNGADGFGVQSMRERAEEIGGRLIVTSTSSRGTSVNLTVPPLAAARAHANGPVVSNQAQPAHVIRVLVVDDHPLFREAVSRLLERESDIRVIDKVGSANEAAAAVGRLRPDVVLLDVELPDASGIEVVRHLARLGNPPPALMVSAFPESGRVVAAMKAGARGYVAKTIEGQSLVEAVRAIASGATMFDAATGSNLWSPQRLAELTRRETDVLRLVAAGRTNAEIADELCLAKKTVERIVATGVNKLHARNRAHAVAKAVSLKLLAVELD